MNRVTRLIRNIGGILSILTLLGMLIVTFVYPRYYISERILLVLLAMISAFLGIDVLREHKIMVAMVLKGALEGYLDFKKFEREEESDE